MNQNQRNIQFFKVSEASANQIVVDIIEESSSVMSYRFPDGNVYEFRCRSRNDFVNHQIGLAILHSISSPVWSNIAGPDNTPYEIWSFFGHQIALRPSRYFSDIQAFSSSRGIDRSSIRSFQRKSDLSFEDAMNGMNMDDEDDGLFEGKLLSEAMAKMDFFNGHRSKFKKFWTKTIGGPYIQDAEDLYMSIVKRDFSVISQLIKNKKYVQWVRYCFLNYDDIEGQYQFYEEVPRWNKAINIFDDYSKRGAGRDIFEFKTLFQLEEFLSKKGMMELQTSLKAEEVMSLISTGHVEKVAENDKYLILSPKTSSACVYLGKGTEWCISKYGNNDSRTSGAQARYSLFTDPSDPLKKIFVVFAKNEKKRWAIQLRSREFKNEAEQTEKDPQIRQEIADLLKQGVGKAANAISTTL